MSVSDFDPPTRDLVDQWLRALTIFVDRSRSPAQRMDQLQRVADPGKLSVRLTTPLRPEEARKLDEAFAGLSQLYRRQIGVHILVDDLLMRWLGQATGATRSEIITRLALTIDGLLPPDETAQR